MPQLDMKNLLLNAALRDRMLPDLSCLGTGEIALSKEGRARAANAHHAFQEAINVEFKSVDDIMALQGYNEDRLIALGLPMEKFDGSGGSDATAVPAIAAKDAISPPSGGERPIGAANGRHRNRAASGTTQTALRRARHGAGF